MKKFISVIYNNSDKSDTAGGFYPPGGCFMAKYIRKTSEIMTAVNFYIYLLESCNLQHNVINIIKITADFILVYFLILKYI